MVNKSATTYHSCSPELEWSETLLDGEKVTYAEAESATGKLGSGWRLPTRQELESILDLTRCDPAIDTNKFQNTKSAFYWTATAFAHGANWAKWVVHFGRGHVLATSPRTKACVRAVRTITNTHQERSA